MSTAAEKISSAITSIRETVGASYKKPDPIRIDTYHKALYENEEAINYLHKDRALTDDTIRKFKLGYDVVKHAISIPVFKRGELVNIKYRFLKPDNIKYTQERDAEVWLFNDDGIQRGMEKGGVLVVEGEFDCMSAWQAGFENVISPASGKDSYGVWIELLDALPRVYIAYDNDDPGRNAALKMAERVGSDKCQEVLYPQGIKDANDYFKLHTASEFKRLIGEAKPFYKYKFKSLSDIMADLRAGKQETTELKFLPDVKIGKDWLIVVSGKSNVGKTSYVMNLVADLTKQDKPCLVLPFERGPEVVGTRFIQVKYGLHGGEASALPQEDWDKIFQEAIHLPLYFAMPDKKETMDIIRRAHRLFGIKAVIIDHLDYMIRNSQNKEAEIGNTLQDLKRLAEELSVMMFIVSHVRKIDSVGAARSKKPGIEDLKGSSSLYQDPECVVMLQAEGSTMVSINVVKNKGKMNNKTFSFNLETGQMREVDDMMLQANAQAVSDF